MVTANPRVPGVYRQEQSARSLPLLPTGVPAFIGLVQPSAPAPLGAALTANGYGPVALRRKADFTGGALAYLGQAVTGFFDNGGDYCYVIGVRSQSTDPSNATLLSNALRLLEGLSDVDLIAIPDAVALGRTMNAAGVVLSVNLPAALSVQQAMIAHCAEQGGRFALLDAVPGKSAAELIDAQLKPLRVPPPLLGPQRSSSEAISAALYHPWIRTIATDAQFVPPSGHVAGVIARTDALGGVFKPPANAEIQGATDLQADLDEAAMGELNRAGINCLRAFAARGIRVWGARTISTASEWRYLNVRRLVLTVLRWIDRNLTWAAFEPNVPALWARIQRELNAYLSGLWRAGALQGEAIDQAFYVRCDAELNPLANRELGQVVTEIGLAATLPAEFIVLSVQHRAGTTELI